MENKTASKLDWLVEYKNSEGDTCFDKVYDKTEDEIVEMLSEYNKAGNKVKNYAVII